MSRTAEFTPEIISSARSRLGSAKTIAQLREAQCILLPALFGLTKAQTAEAMGLSTSRVGGLQAQLRNPSPETKSTHGGRRRQRMTLEDETTFLAPWVEEARTAGMIIVPPLHEALVKQLGKKIHHSQVYRMLARHGWRKVAPDSIHPKANEALQEDWKKNSRNWWPGS